MAVQAHFEEGIRHWGLPRLKTVSALLFCHPSKNIFQPEGQDGLYLWFSAAQEPGPQEIQQMSGSPSVFWKEAACAPPNSQAPNPLAAGVPTLGTTDPPPHSQPAILPAHGSPHHSPTPVGCCLGNQGAVGTSCWPRHVSIKLLWRSCLIKGLLWAH